MHVGMPGGIWGIFIALTALHIFANVRAMRCLQLRSLNRPRLALLLRSYMATQVSTCSGARTLGTQCCDSLSGVKHMLRIRCAVLVSPPLHRHPNPLIPIHKPLIPVISPSVNPTACRARAPGAC